MRTIELSNHPADALRIARRRHATGARRERAEFAESIARAQLLVGRAERARDTARAERRWLTWLRATLAVRRIRRLTPLGPAAASAPSAEQERLGAGVAGEQQVARELGLALGDDWVLLRGYRNKRGEIDHLLLGPPGLVAIESKHLNATVSCDGDDWSFNEPATVLEEFLTARRGPVSILRVVLLTHPNSRRGTCRKPTVHITTSATALASQLTDMPPVLTAAQRARLEELISRDHRYHEARRPPRRPPAAWPRGARTGRSARSASR